MLASRALPLLASRAIPAIAAALPRPAQHSGTAASPKTVAAGPMFCYQCEQTTHGEGCTTVGVCGKTPETAALQDLLVHKLKGLAALAVRAKDVDIAPEDVAPAAFFFRSAIFSTLTNVNFDPKRFISYLCEADDQAARLRSAISRAGATVPEASTVPWFADEVHPVNAAGMAEASYSASALVARGRAVGVDTRTALAGDATLVGLHELVTYGVKGAAAYAHHAAVAGVEEAEATSDLMRALAFLCTSEAGSVPAVLAKALEVGEANLRIMAALERAHTQAFGHPSPAPVRMGPREGKAILITGHDLPDLQALLEQTAGSGVNVYTHGEMLPAHGYPELRKHPHLVGHFGGAWYRQKQDFDKFPGPVLVTTNCVLEPPRGTYADRLFTTGETGVPGVRHLAPRDFTAVVARALELPGFTAADEAEGDGVPAHTAGFGREAMLGAAPAVLAAMAEGKLNHVFLVGGCDGSEGSRRYYQSLAGMLPDTSVVLTLGCAKYRLLGHDFGKVPGTDIPRLLDMGQCNDSFAAVQLALALADATGAKSVNDLPLSLDLSWFEQKAVAVLLSLLHLGVTDIRLGPRLPAFVTPEALKVLVDTYSLKPAELRHPEEDVANMLRHGH